jgi:hypothetical protein
MPDATESDEVEKPQDIKLSRRGALARLGLTAATVYVAPTIFHIDRDAQAFVVPSPCSTGRGRRSRRCKRKGGGKNKRGKSNKRNNHRRTSNDRARRNRRNSSWANNRGNSRGRNRSRW